MKTMIFFIKLVESFMKEEIWVVKGRSLLDYYLDNAWVGALMILMMGLRVLSFLWNLG